MSNPTIVTKLTTLFKGIFGRKDPVVTTVQDKKDETPATETAETAVKAEDPAETAGTAEAAAEAPADASDEKPDAEPVKKADAESAQEKPASEEAATEDESKEEAPAEAEAPALRDHCHRAGLQRLQLRGAAEADAGVVLQVEESEAIGPDHAHVRCACRSDEPILKRLSGITHFTETAGEHQRERNARVAALFDRSGYLWRGQGDQRDVARLRDGAEVRIAGESLDFVVLRIDGVDLPRIAEVGEQPQRLSPDAARVPRNADHRDPARIETAREIGSRAGGAVRHGCDDFGHSRGSGNLGEANGSGSPPSRG